ncbi:MAG: hypothetical protein KH156_11335, partial [Alistipes sp.]|nr:hypothetical protein [Alistipes sp.]
PYIHNNRFYSIRSKHKGKYLLILLQDALERIFTVFKKFNNSRFRIAILSNFAFLLHPEMHSFRNSYFVDILYSERGKEQFNEVFIVLQKR